MLEVINREGKQEVTGEGVGFYTGQLRKASLRRHLIKPGRDEAMKRSGARLFQAEMRSVWLDTERYDC